MNDNYFNEVLEASKIDGNLLIPSVYSHINFENEFTDRQLETLYESAIKYFPNIIQYIPDKIKYYRPIINTIVPTDWFRKIWKEFTILHHKLSGKYIYMIVNFDEYKEYIINESKYIECNDLVRMLGRLDNGNWNNSSFVEWSFAYNIIFNNINRCPSLIDGCIPSHRGSILCIDNESIERLKKYVELYKIALQIDGIYLRNIKFSINKTFELCKIAIENNPIAIQYVPQPSNNTELNHIGNIKISEQNYIDLCKIALIKFSLQRIIPTISNKIIVLSTKKIRQKIIFTWEYLHDSYNILHQYFISQLNLMKIAANSNILIDVYDVISEFI